MKRVTVAIITVAYNSASDLRAYWQHRAESSRVLWIVVDNNSQDDSVAVAQALGADQVVRLEKNIGFSAANNVGASMVSPLCYVFANPDIRINWESIVEIAEEAVASSAIIGPQLLNPDGTRQGNGRLAPYLYRKVLHLTGLWKTNNRYEVVALADSPRPVAWLMGAAVVVPATIFRMLQGWDEKFFLYYEDSDLCIRARNLGVHVVLQPQVTWTHGWARATRSFNPRAWRMELVAAARFYGRYPGLLLHPRLMARSSNAAYLDSI